MFKSVSNHAAKSRPTRRRIPTIFIVLAAIPMIVFILLCGLVISLGPSKEERLLSLGISTETQLRSLSFALNAFNRDVGRYPTTAEGLAALLVRPPGLTESQWRGPYLDELPRDAFGRDFHYAFPGVHGRPFDLGSSGRDKTWGTPDDITNAPSP